MINSARDLQNEILNRVEPGMSDYFKRFVRSPLLIIANTDLPLFGCYIQREERTQDGDNNHGPPHFYHRLTMRLAGACSLETEEMEDAAVDLEAQMAALDPMLLSDPKFVMLTEAVLGSTWQSQYTKVGDATLAEIVIDMTFSYRTIWEPVVPDDFKVLHVTGKYPPNAAPGSTQEIIREWDIPQN